MNPEALKASLEAVLMASGKAMSLDALFKLYAGQDLAKADIHAALQALQEDCLNRGIELKQVASGYRFQVKQAYVSIVSGLWEEKPKKYSRALLETLALVAYRQPVTRGEIEKVRGVSVSSYIIKTLLDREWVQVIGHKEVPGRPALYATTKNFLDYFNLTTLDELPSLKELQDIDAIHPVLDLEPSEPDADQTTH